MSLIFLPGLLCFMIKIRVCINEGTCYTRNKTETQGCTYTSSVCMEDWSCSQWSECSSKEIQTRTCYDKNNCGITLNKPTEEKGCTYIEQVIEKPAVSKKNIYNYISGFVIAVIIIVVVFGRKNLKKEFILKTNSIS